MDRLYKENKQAGQSVHSGWVSTKVRCPPGGGVHCTLSIVKL